MVTNNQPTAPAVLTQEPFNAWDTLPHDQSIYNFSWPVPIFYRDYKDNYKSQSAKFKWLPPVGYSPCPASFAVSRKPTEVQMESAHWDMDNANASSFVRVEYDDIGYDRLMQRIRIKPDEFSLGDKIILLADRLAFLQRKMLRNEPFSYDRLMDVITTVLPGDTQFGMFEEAQKVIDPLELMFLDGPDYGLFKVLRLIYLHATRYLLLPYAVRYDLSDSVDEGRRLFEEMLQECATTATGVDKCNK
ncbi:unnamed protein product [Anisakis simplex]|uniref:Similar to n=1 Tax=Anisakis simplex TaxID=6269 RepID=A0A0M3J4N7_ANISI|nr:unnamed protein product [Anisakis simplex]